MGNFYSSEAVCLVYMKAKGDKWAGEITSGLFGTADKSNTIRRGVTEFTAVVPYDRTGLGHGEPGPVPRTSAQMAVELHKLLH